MTNFEKIIKKLNKEQINRLIDYFCHDNCLFYSKKEGDIIYSEGDSHNLPCNLCPFIHENDCSKANAEYLKRRLGD